MILKQYQNNSKRTMNMELDEEQLLSNMVFGIVGETGEVVDVLKKHLYQGHELDVDHIEEELGDIMFYMVNLATILELDMETIIKRNYNKLLKRYPEGFDSERSVNRA